MVETKICSRSKCVEGETDPDGGVVSFTFKKSNGDYYKSCDRCRKRDLRERHKYARKAEASRMMKVDHDECVYAIKHKNEIVYIGHSDNAGWRLYEHFHKGPKHSVLGKNGINKLIRNLEYSWHVIWHGGSLEDAKHQEKVLIQIHQPKFNKIKYKNYEG